MTAWTSDAAVDEGLAALRAHDASAERTERIRARCLAALEARRHEDEARKDAPASWRRWLEPVFALGLGVLFVAEAVARALAVYAAR